MSDLDQLNNLIGDILQPGDQAKRQSAERVLANHKL